MGILQTGFSIINAVEILYFAKGIIIVCCDHEIMWTCIFIKLIKIYLLTW